MQKCVPANAMEQLAPGLLLVAAVVAACLLVHWLATLRRPRQAPTPQPARPAMNSVLEFWEDRELHRQFCRFYVSDTWGEVVLYRHPGGLGCTPSPWYRLDNGHEQVGASTHINAWLRTQAMHASLSEAHSADLASAKRAQLAGGAQ